LIWLVAVTVQEPAVDGALNRPLELTVPHVVVHVTEVFAVPATVAMICSEAFTAILGLTETVTTGAVTVMMAEAKSAELTWLVAVMVQVPVDAGAVYSPLAFMLPQDADQFTAVSRLPVTVELNGKVVLAFIDPDVGLIATATIGGIMMRLAEAESDGFA